MSYQRQKETKQRNEHKLHQAKFRGGRGSYYFDTEKGRVIRYNSARILKYARKLSNRRVRHLINAYIQQEDYDNTAVKTVSGDLDPFH